MTEKHEREAEAVGDGICQTAPSDAAWLLYQTPHSYQEKKSKRFKCKDMQISYLPLHKPFWLRNNVSLTYFLILDRCLW
jgi:hypothetical protein